MLRGQFELLAEIYTPVCGIKLSFFVTQLQG